MLIRYPREFAAHRYGRVTGICPNLVAFIYQSHKIEYMQQIIIKLSRSPIITASLHLWIPPRHSPASAAAALLPLALIIDGACCSGRGKDWWGYASPRPCLCGCCFLRLWLLIDGACCSGGKDWCRVQGYIITIWAWCTFKLPEILAIAALLTFWPRPFLRLLSWSLPPPLSLSGPLRPAQPSLQTTVAFGSSGCSGRSLSFPLQYPSSAWPIYSA